jgi:dolichol kinase
MMSQQEPNEKPVTRNTLHIPRRLFHLLGGLGITLIYGPLFDHLTAVHIIGTAACCFFIFEHARIRYPEYNAFFTKIAKPFLRAEEHLKESALLPFIIGVFLTILSFPKAIALASILVLSFCDPLAAIFGILFSKHKNKAGKSFEGSLAFFISSFLVIFLFFHFTSTDINYISLLIVTFVFSILITFVERLPSRLDDNLIIPIASGFILWFLCKIFEIPLF